MKWTGKLLQAFHKDRPKSITRVQDDEAYSNMEKKLEDFCRAHDPDYDADLSAMDEGRLYRREIFWRDHYHWLKEKGYLLRSRYHPEWVASWKHNNRPSSFCADGRVSGVRGLN